MIKEFLKNKGWIGTILGVCLGFPIGIGTTAKYFYNPEFTKMELITVFVLIGLAMMWVMLPSRVKISKTGIEVED